MAHLPFISDDNFFKHVHAVLEVGITKKQKADRTFYKNVIDPFGPIFEATVNSISVDDWKKFEKVRQGQKTLQNAVGDFHNDVLGSVNGWEKLEKGNEIDLIKNDLSIIAEVKNKYNTVTGSKLVDHYVEFDNLVNNKASKYSGATAYFVQIIPKKPKPYNKCFRPSDKAKGMKKYADENIRSIDGRSFYAMVTGIEDALDQLHKQIPIVIQELGHKEYGFSDGDISEFTDFFTRAYLES
ncbi:MAG: Eco47II family restriction endonuclease [Robiginitomaculum sp.]